MEKTSKRSLQFVAVLPIHVRCEVTQNGDKRKFEWKSKIFKKPPIDAQNWRKKGQENAEENTRSYLSTVRRRLHAAAKKQTGDCCWSCSVHHFALSLIPTFPFSFFKVFSSLSFVVSWFFSSVHDVRIWVNFGSMQQTSFFLTLFFFYLISAYLFSNESSLEVYRWTLRNL